MNTTGLGASIKSEWATFGQRLNSAAHKPGEIHYVEIDPHTSVQGNEDSFIVSMNPTGGEKLEDTLQIHYEELCKGAGDPVLKRSVALHNTCDIDQKQGRLRTLHQDTVVRERDAEVLGNQTLSTMAAYPGQPGCREGVVIWSKEIVGLPTSKEQNAQLDTWNISLGSQDREYRLTPSRSGKG